MNTNRTDFVVPHPNQLPNWILRFAADEQPRFVILNEVKDPSEKLRRSAVDGRSRRGAVLPVRQAHPFDRLRMTLSGVEWVRAQSLSRGCALFGRARQDRAPTRERPLLRPPHPRWWMGRPGLSIGMLLAGRGFAETALVTSVSEWTSHARGDRNVQLPIASSSAAVQGFARAASCVRIADTCSGAIGPALLPHSCRM
jgi:hypothetical protein